MRFNMRKINIQYFVHVVNTEGGVAKLCDTTDADQQGSVERCSVIKYATAGAERKRGVKANRLLLGG